MFFVFEEKKFSLEISKIDKLLDGAISKLFKKEYFKGKEKEIHMIETQDKIKADKIILVGLGKKEKFKNEYLKRALFLGLTYAKNHSIKDIAVILESADSKTLEDVGIVSTMFSYNFNHYKTQDKSKIKEIKNIKIYLSNIDRKYNYNSALDRAIIIGSAVNWARDLINHPSNHITPKMLAKYAKYIKNGVKTKILGKCEIAKLKMGLILGVAQGSEEEPQLIIMDYKPRKFKDTLVLVGKGLTFDSGGISLKSSEKMEEMKMDMAGAGAVMGIMKAVSSLKPKIRIIGIIPATENLPSGRALKPGDILTSMSGKTVEVMNTDAEGRLILADALFYAQRYKPTAIIDMATLTGSCVHALGSEAAGLLGNNQKLIDSIKESARATGERVWQFPLWDEYRDMIKGELADLNNVGEGRQAGTITAAAFLENFVGNYSWAHLDIAGTAILSKAKHYNPKGGTGYGVRLIVDLIDRFNQ